MSYESSVKKNKRDPSLRSTNKLSELFSLRRRKKNDLIESSVKKNASYISDEYKTVLQHPKTMLRFGREFSFYPR